MKRLIQLCCRLSFLTIILIHISCKKDRSVDEQNEIVYPINFTIKQFQGSSQSFLNARTHQNSEKLASTSGVNSQNYAEGYLYFFSFNNDNLLPDIKYQTQKPPSITYGNNLSPTAFVNSTYAFDGTVAGRAITIPAGNRDILIKFPIDGAIDIKRLGLDAGSPDTGPKDFDIYFSVDEGVSYQTISQSNHFGTLVSNAKNSYIFDLFDFRIASKDLWIKITAKEGVRPTNNAAFNTSSGIFRLDNLYLIGSSPIGDNNSTINKIHYHVFHKDKEEIQFNGLITDINAPVLKLDLPLGKYEMMLSANKSSSDLILPMTSNRTNFYLSNHFSNFKAEIFGQRLEFEVKGEVNNSIQLDRLHAQIKVEFTDVANLSIIKKIQVTPLHEPFYFAPFNNDLINPILDQSSIEFAHDFADNKQIVFNQFLGMTDVFVPVTYQLVIYGENGVLKTLQIGSTIKNNMQLVFRGAILDGVSQHGTFQITKNETWNGEKEIVF